MVAYHLSRDLPLRIKDQIWRGDLILHIPENPQVRTDGAELALLDYTVDGRPARDEEGDTLILTRSAREIAGATLDHVMGADGTGRTRAGRPEAWLPDHLGAADNPVAHQLADLGLAHISAGAWAQDPYGQGPDQVTAHKITVIVPDTIRKDLGRVFSYAPDEKKIAIGLPGRAQLRQTYDRDPHTPLAQALDPQAPSPAHAELTKIALLDRIAGQSPARRDGHPLTVHGHPVDPEQLAEYCAGAHPITKEDLDRSLGQYSQDFLLLLDRYARASRRDLVELATRRIDLLGDVPTEVYQEFITSGGYVHSPKALAALDRPEPGSEVGVAAVDRLTDPKTSARVQRAWQIGNQLVGPLADGPDALTAADFDRGVDVAGYLAGIEVRDSLAALMAVEQLEQSAYQAITDRTAATFGPVAMFDDSYSDRIAAHQSEVDATAPPEFHYTEEDLERARARQRGAVRAASRQPSRTQQQRQQQPPAPRPQGNPPRRSDDAGLNLGLGL